MKNFVLGNKIYSLIDITAVVLLLSHFFFVKIQSLYLNCSCIFLFIWFLEFSDDPRQVKQSIGANKINVKINLVV